MKTFQKVAWIGGLVLLVATAAWAEGDKKPEKIVTVKGIEFTEAAWGAIVKKAKAEKKIIFLDAYASWCGPCKLLQKNVFTRPDVGELFNKNFVNVKVDMERGEGPQLARMFPLEAYPTLFFIDPNGKVIKKVIGYQSPETLISIGKSLVTNQ
ncbi:thioredoxin family protein [Telluribacter sp.]|jgi:thiol:disulfide interchange protein|uniref:thioredoxin family protein n=1 Tax=Telluribacter sp. TaxID=1978767 RepID=UPI002E1198E9|nr:thioredoxin family protein [Telluribacter sp.]